MDYEEELEPWYKGPIKYVLGIFLILLLLLTIIPYYAIKLDPEPQNVPLIKVNYSIPKINSNDINNYISTNSEIKQLADQIVTLSCPNAEKICNAKAMFYFVKKNINYVNDPIDREYYKTPQETLNSRNGDCDDQSILLASLLQAIGLETRFKFVPGHVFVEVKLLEAPFSYKDKEGWIKLDPTCQDCNFGEQHYSVK
jgi:hypothetical protein